MAAPGKLLAGILACGLLAAQDPLNLLAAAEKSIAAGPNEAALLQLLAAGKLLRAAAPSSGRDAALQTLAALEPKADIAFQLRSEAEAATGKRLLDLARAYRNRNWFQSAAALCQQAAAFDAAGAGKELASLVKQQPQLAPKAGAAAGGPPKSAIEQLARLEVVGDWKQRDGKLWSPANQSKTDSSRYLTKATQKNGRIAVTFDVGNRDAMAGLVFGMANLDDYYILDLNSYRDGGLGADLYHWHDDELERLVGGGQIFKKAAADRRLEVRVHDKTVTCSVDGVTLFSHTVASAPYGNIGFHISAATPCRDAIAIHDFELGALADATEDEIAAAETARYKEIVAVTNDAERLLKQKQPEQAVERWHGARSAALQLQPGSLREGLLTAIDKQLAAADSLHARRVKTLAEAAQGLRGAADRYAEAGWLQVGVQVINVAAQLDPDGQALAAAVLAEKLAQKTAAEPQQGK